MTTTNENGDRRTKWIRGHEYVTQGSRQQEALTDKIAEIVVNQCPLYRNCLPEGQRKAAAAKLQQYLS